MARNIDDRLRALNTRRKGTDRIAKLAADSAAEVLQKSTIQEAWQKRAVSQPFTRYALGAMQAVTARYTEIGIETALRVGKQLAEGLTRSVIFRLQGSVPLDVHIRGVSDVDLLTLDTAFLTYASYGPKGQSGAYWPTASTSLGVLTALRKEAETLLKEKYPKATVDCSGGKCISLSGGSLARPVDVVPAHWNDTYDYQVSGQEHDRGVTILDKKVPETVDNLPFLHIKRVHDRDITCLGGMKKAIRLIKNVKNDAENESSAAKLPSFDIAGLMYHADQTAFIIGYNYELSILREAQRFMDWCYHNKDAAMKLRTPDSSRCILNTTDKFEGLTTISVELDKLAQDVAKEQSFVLRSMEHPDWSSVERALRNTRIPEAA